MTSPSISPPPLPIPPSSSSSSASNDQNQPNDQNQDTNITQNQSQGYLHHHPDLKPFTPLIANSHHDQTNLDHQINQRPSLHILQPTQHFPDSQSNSKDRTLSPSSSSINSDRQRPLSSSSLATSDPNLHQSQSHPSPSSNVSRASSARSTSSVQAVPFKIPERASFLGQDRSQSHSPLPSFMIPTGSYSSSIIPTPPLSTNISNTSRSSIDPSPHHPPPLLSSSSSCSSIPTSSFDINLANHQAKIIPSNSSSPIMHLSPLVQNLSIHPSPILNNQPDLRNQAIPDLAYNPTHPPHLTHPAPPPPLIRTSSGPHATPRKGIQDYTVGDVLGEGSYSTVYLATDKTAPHKQYALKVLDKRHIQKEKKIKYVAIERDTLNLLDHHPGCIRLYATFQDESSLYYLLEYAPKGEILRAIKSLGSFSTVCARFYSAQILSAIEHMHTRGVIHRDIKPENILLDSELRIKIADFGSAKILPVPGAAEENSQRSHSFVGTAEYVSPELLLQKVTCKSSDLWAFGCVLFQMIAGIPPFRSRSEYLTFQKITHLDYQFPDGFPEDAKDLVSRLLVLDPTHRIGASEERAGITEIKVHSFYTSIDWNQIWKLTPPVLEAGLVIANRPIESVIPEIPTYAEFSHQESAPSLDQQPSPPQQEQELEQQQGFVISPVRDEGLSDTDDEPKNGFSSALHKRKSWLLGASRRKLKDDDLTPVIGGEMAWAEMFLPNELMIYSSAVNELTHQAAKVVGFRTKKKKKRQLILTDFPRLLCVKEDEKSSKVKVKYEILFKPLPNDFNQPSPTLDSIGSSATIHPNIGHLKSASASSTATATTISAAGVVTAAKGSQPVLGSSRPIVDELDPDHFLQHQQPNGILLFKKVEMENERCFKIETYAKEPWKHFKFEDKSEAAERWTAEINLAYENANKPKPAPSSHIHHPHYY